MIGLSPLDDLFGPAGPAAVRVEGRDGADTLIGGDADDRLWGEVAGPVVLAPAERGFSFFGFEDVLSGRGGDDRIVGDVRDLAVAAEDLTVVMADDTLSGGSGADRIWGDAQEPLRPTTPGPAVFPASGAEVVIVAPPVETVPIILVAPFASTVIGGDDHLSGGRGADRIVGDANRISAATGGADDLSGGRGDDVMFGDGLRIAGFLGAAAGGDDRVFGNRGDDRLFGDARELIGGTFGPVAGGDDTLGGGAGDDVLHGDGLKARPFGFVAPSGGDDRLSGGGGDDRLFGDFRSGSIDRDGGADTLRGGAGDDTLTGGGGGDRFVLSAGDDVVTDFAAAEGDVVRLAGFFDSRRAALEAVHYADGEAILSFLDGDGRAASLTLRGLAPDSLGLDDFV